MARSPSSALLSPFLGEGSPTKIDYRKRGTLILTSLLEDLEAQKSGSMIFLWQNMVKQPEWVGGYFEPHGMIVREGLSNDSAPQIEKMQPSQALEPANL